MRKRNEEIPEYVAALPVRFLADWAGLAHWSELPGYRDHFWLVLESREDNVAILERKGPVPSSDVATVR